MSSFADPTVVWQRCTPRSDEAARAPEVDLPDRSGFGVGLNLGFLTYRSGLLPRGTAWLGLVGGPPICLSCAAVRLGVAEAGSAGVLVLVATLPITDGPVDA